MRNKVAKMLRKTVYGDLSLRKRGYVPVSTPKVVRWINKLTGKRTKTFEPVPRIEADKYRKTYKFFKRKWNEFNHKQRGKGIAAAQAIQASR